MDLIHGIVPLDQQKIYNVMIEADNLIKDFDSILTLEIKEHIINYNNNKSIEVIEDKYLLKADMLLKIKNK